MSKTSIKPPPRGAKGGARIVGKPAGKPPGKAQLQHPMLDEARRLAAAGKPREAADTMEALARQVPPFEQAQLLTLAANFVRGVDRKRALGLAEAATQARTDLTQAWLTLSYIKDDARDRKGAVAAARKALETRAKPRELVDIGRHLSRLGEDATALEAVRRGFTASGEAIGLASFTLRVAVQCADWELADRITTRLRAEHAEGRTREAGETPRTHLLWCADEEINIKVISAFAEKMFAAQPPLRQGPWPDAGKRKLRVGYLSYDYRDHATTLLAMGLMRHHDRERFQFYAYCTSWDDGSAIRRDLLSRFDVARSFAQASDRKAAEQIVADKIDVLVDLNGLTEGTRHGILAWRPAPVQISYLGFPGTAGGRFVDYIIGDDYTVPTGTEALYPEKVIRIPPTYQINDYAARWLPPPPRRAAVGLPEGAPVIGMFNNVNKVGAGVWATWMEILRGAPAAVLWMLDPGEVARINLARAAETAGVGSTRILFAPKARQEAHMARLQLCSLVLDPWPYGGHTTTGDALFAGVPVVALEGSNFASRVSGGLLRAAGLAPLLRPDKAAYVQTALDLLRQPAEIAKIRQYLRQRRARLPVFDAATRTRQLEAAYLAAHERVVKGLPPDHLHVGVKRPPQPNTDKPPGKPSP